MDILIYKKGQRKKLSKHLSHDEFDCQCKMKICTHTLITIRNIKSYEGTRKDFGSPVIVSSGHRCQIHNLHENGVSDSNHYHGDAIDLVPLNGNMIGLVSAAKKNYKFVKVYDTFVHCDNRFNIQGD